MCLSGQNYEYDAKWAAEDYGLTMGRFVILGEMGNGWLWMMPAEKSEPLAQDYIDDMIEALTKPLTKKEAKPKQAKKGDYSSIKVDADSYGELVAEVNRIFGENKWTDGLGIVPPTREAVDWMLTGTSRSPDEYLATFEPRFGKATVEKVAINAVMAGALPEYLPVLIAGVEAMGYPEHRSIHYTAHNFGASVIVSGPIVDELGMNGLQYYLSSGNQATNTIGRAMNLCRINFGHLEIGKNEMSGGMIHGMYTGTTYAEAYKESPWPAFHVAQGFDQEDSCVTVSHVNGPPTATGGYQYSQTTIGGYMTTEEKIAQILEMTTKWREGAFSLPGVTRRDEDSPWEPLPWPSAIFTHHFNGYMIALSPDAAQELVDMGFETQEDLQQFFWESTLVPCSDLTEAEKESIAMRVEYTERGFGWMLESDFIPEEQLPMWKQCVEKGTGHVPYAYAPEAVKFIVCGPARTERMSPIVPAVEYWRDGKEVYGQNQVMTKKIHGATLTKAGR